MIPIPFPIHHSDHDDIVTTTKLIQLSSGRIIDLNNIHSTKRCLLRKSWKVTTYRGADLVLPDKEYNELLTLFKEK
jgi:hypothetical protein